MNEMISASELGKLFRVKAPTILSWWRAGMIPGHQINRRTVRFDFEEVRAALEHRRGES